MGISELYNLYLQHPVITTDSRNCPEGSIFFALKGESFDGNAFAGAALEKGCAYAVIDEKEYAREGDPRFILTENVLKTFKELAREHRRHYDIPVIGITGTNGKTTTKELVSAVLSERYHVMHTEGNFNNDVGVPKTLLRMDHSHDVAVIEMGASHPGDIRKLVEYAEPTCGLITNVGRAHLQGFGSFEGVMQTKGELYDYLKTHEALVFLNGSNPYLTAMAQDRDLQRIISYGQTDDVNFSGEVIGNDPYVRFRWRELNGEWREVQTQLVGAYNIDNLMAAVAVGKHFLVSDEEIRHALENYTPSNSRSQLVETGKNKLIVDTYNANPTSMAAALDNFIGMQVDMPKMAILGDMRELGEQSAEEHQKIVDGLKDIPEVWLVGEEFGRTRCDFRKFKDVGAVKEAIRSECPEGRYILIKGSNGIRLFELPELL